MASDNGTEDSVSISSKILPERSSRRRVFSKCTFCRQTKRKCLPVTRDWDRGEKCEACIKSGHPCGPNESFGESNVTLKRPHSAAFQTHEYQYSSLGHDHILLFKLHPGGRAQELEGNFFESDGHDDYEALSHEWESQERTSSLKILSVAEAYRLPVFPSLEEALRDLRYPDRARVLWADTLCIDRDNHEETSAQVSRVGKTYNEASNVCIWLGPDDPRTSAVLLLMKKVLHVDFLQEAARDRAAVNDLFEFLRFMKHPWFRRVWSVATISTARPAVIYCGRESIRWRDFAEAILVIKENAGFLGQLYRTSDSFRYNPDFAREFNDFPAISITELEATLFRRSPDGRIMERLLPLEAVVCKLSPFECKDPRDIIYAALPLSNGVRPYLSRTDRADGWRADSRLSDDLVILNRRDRSRAQWVLRRMRDLLLSTRFLVDYSKSLDEVYQGLYEFVIRRTRSLDVMCGVHLPGSGLPSWVSSKKENAPFHLHPNGGPVRVNADPLLSLHLGATPVYHAAGRTPARLRFGVGDRQGSLFASGFVLDTVYQTLPPAITGSVPFEWLTLLRGMNSVVSDPDLVWRILVADRGNNGQAAPLYYRSACDHSLSLSLPDSDVHTSELLRSERGPVVLSFLERARSVIWRRRLISSAEYEFMGLAPSTTRSGDVLCILYGCSAPVVLRKSDSNKDTGRLPGEQYYQLIGACYIDGMMEGEALKVKNEQDLRLQEFEIR